MKPLNSVDFNSIQFVFMNMQAYHHNVYNKTSSQTLKKHYTNKQTIKIRREESNTKEVLEQKS